MTQYRDGGPAFPVGKRQGENYMDDAGYARSRTVTILSGGMTLRDWFAGMAIAGALATESSTWAGHDSAYDLAAVAYEFADAMIAAREGK